MKVFSITADRKFFVDADRGRGNRVWYNNFLGVFFFLNLADNCVFCLFLSEVVYGGVAALSERLRHRCHVNGNTWQTTTQSKRTGQRSAGPVCLLFASNIDPIRKRLSEINPFDRKFKKQKYFRKNYPKNDVYKSTLLNVLLVPGTTRRIRIVRQQRRTNE